MAAGAGAGAGATTRGATKAGPRPRGEEVDEGGVVDVGWGRPGWVGVVVEGGVDFGEVVTVIGLTVGKADTLPRGETRIDPEGSAEGGAGTANTPPALGWVLAAAAEMAWRVVESWPIEVAGM